MWKAINDYKRPLAAAALITAGALSMYELCKGTDSRHNCLRGGQLDSPDQKIFPNYFANADGLWIHTRQWVVPDARGIVFICHGLGEHVGRYESLARQINSLGMSVYGMDHQGHGLSHGDRVHVQTFDHFPRDYQRYMIRVQSQYSTPLPCFLLGHSMGGLIAAYTARDLPVQAWPLAGLVLSAGAFAPGSDINRFTMALVGVLASIRPKIILPDSIAAHKLSTHPQVPEAYVRDPGVYSGGMRISIGNAILTAMRDLHMRGLNPSTRVLVLQGSADEICEPRGSDRVMKMLPDNMMKELKTYEGVRHELLWRSEPVADVCVFLEAVLGSSD